MPLPQMENKQVSQIHSDSLQVRIIPALERLASARVFAMLADLKRYSQQ
jgi:MFS superfamily sulfate permease-like transporter